MFKTCIYCQRSLGQNERVENFPVGRRLAFDQEKGRLWVVCERCRRWNLSPLEQRWEAIEECERIFRDTGNRFSTDNIGLARLSEGTELVRIGRPERREFAAWRYGRQFLRRRLVSLAKMGARIAAATAMAFTGVYAFYGVLSEQQDRIVARLKSADGRRLFVPLKDARKVRLVRAPERQDGWMLSLPYRIQERNWGILGRYSKGKRQFEEIEGPEAIHAAGRILPKVNSFGGSNTQVQDAVKRIEEARSPEAFFAVASASPGKVSRGNSLFSVEASQISKMDATTRLALEMAAHEDSERRALEGELALLEEAWREAEEIAGIADRLLIPESVENWIRRQKAKLGVS